MLGATIALLAGVGGCSFVPTYHRPDAGTPQQFAAAQAQPVFDAPTQAGWWSAFGDPELAALETRALAQNNDLAAAESRVEEARAEARIAAAAQYPTLGAAVSGSADTGDPTSRPGSDLRRSGSAITYAAQASYEFDFWGRNRALAGSARALATASAADRDTLTITVTAMVADSYFQILSLNERIRTADQIATDAAHVLSLIEAQHSVGTATVLQIEQQRTLLATFQGVVPILRQQQEAATHMLAVLLALPPETVMTNKRTLADVALPLVDPGLPSNLLLRRPDIRAAEARLISANFDVGAARAAFLPNFALTGEAGGASDALSRFSSPVGFASSAASLLMPIFDGGRLKGQLRFDRAHAGELAATYRQTVLAAFRDVEDALSARLRLSQAEEAATRAEAAASHAAELSEAQYRIGTTDLLTVLDTQRARYQAQDTLLQLRLQRLQAAISLYRALGGDTGKASS